MQALSGTIDTKELKTLLNYLGQFPDQDALGRVMEALDADGDNALNFEEFSGVLRSLIAPQEVHKEIKEAFKIFDKVCVARCLISVTEPWFHHQDGSGHLTPAEMMKVLNSMGEDLTEEDAEQLVREGDWDGDGKLNYEEVICSAFHCPINHFLFLAVF